MTIVAVVFQIQSDLTIFIVYMYYVILRNLNGMTITGITIGILVSMVLMAIGYEIQPKLSCLR